MSRTFDDVMQGLEEESRRAGPAVVARAENLRARYKLAADFIVLRKRRGVTLRQVSARSGVRQSELSRIEGGRANRTAATLAALAHAVGGELRIVPAQVRKGPSASVPGARRPMPRAAHPSRA